MDQYIITNENSVYYYGEGSPVMPSDEAHTYVRWDTMLYQILEMLAHSGHTLNTIGVYKLVPLTNKELARKIKKTIDGMDRSELDEMWKDITGGERDMQEILGEVDRRV